jgi:hypothetical protein
MTSSEECRICSFCNGPVGAEPWGILSTDANICINCMETHLCIYKSAYPAECTVLLDRIQAADVSWFKGRQRRPKRRRKREEAPSARTSETPSLPTEAD